MNVRDFHTMLELVSVVRRAGRFLVLASIVLVAACSPVPREGGPIPLGASSDTLDVSGAYQPIAIDTVERLTVEAGRLIIHGASGQVAIELPPGVGEPRPGGQQWAIVTEGQAPDKRSVTFTHEQSLDDVTINLPAGARGLRYGTLAAEGDGDVVVFAWVAAERSYWGFVRITRRTPS